MTFGFTCFFSRCTNLGLSALFSKGRVRCECVFAGGGVSLWWERSAEGRVKAWDSVSRTVIWYPVVKLHVKFVASQCGCNSIYLFFCECNYIYFLSFFFAASYLKIRGMLSEANNSFLLILRVCLYSLMLSLICKIIS